MLGPAFLIPTFLSLWMRVSSAAPPPLPGYGVPPPPPGYAPPAPPSYSAPPPLQAIPQAQGGVAHSQGGVAHSQGGGAHSQGGGAHSQGGATLPGSSPEDAIPEQLNYNPELVANDNGYGGRREYCRVEEKIVYADKCEPYTEQTCFTQNVENCQQVAHRNCTGTISTKVERVCFTVNELICSLHQKVEYDTIQEQYHVQKCSVVKEHVCDTTFDIQLSHKDDFKCCDVESEHCEDREFEINDVTCKNTFDFDCQKEKRTDGSYGKEMVCRKTPKNNCYETPRNVRKEVCKQQTQRYCQKFTNPIPQPVERQNCHLEPKKVCQLEARTRNRKAKRYEYFPDCKPVPREICDSTEVNNVAPVCTMENRLDCDYVPVKKCTDEQKQYCWKVEQVVQEEVCDEKFDYQNL